jgi:protein-disulfide isomerase
VVTACWRLLREKIAIGDKLAKWNAKMFGEATCKICQDTMEDLHHSAVECPDKWKVWQRT